MRLVRLAAQPASGGAGINPGPGVGCVGHMELLLKAEWEEGRSILSAEESHHRRGGWASTGQESGRVLFLGIGSRGRFHFHLAFSVDLHIDFSKLPRLLLSQPTQCSVMPPPISGSVF